MRAGIREEIKESVSLFDGPLCGIASIAIDDTVIIMTSIETSQMQQLIVFLGDATYRLSAALVVRSDSPAFLGSNVH